MRISARGIKLIKDFEGRFLKAYYCPAGVLTIGYGHTNLSGVPPKVVPGMTITAAQADEMLRATLARVYEPAVKRNVRVPLTQSQYDALVSFVYNVGEGNFKKSGVLRAVNAKRYNSVPAELMKWTRAKGKVLKGLVNRRQAEGVLWNTQSSVVLPTEKPAEKPEAPEADVDIPPQEPMPQQVEVENESNFTAVWRQVTAAVAGIGAYIFDVRVLVLVGVAVAAYAIWAQAGKPPFWQPSYWRGE